MTDVPRAEAVETLPTAGAPRGDALRSLFRSPQGIVGLASIVLVLAFACIVPIFASDPYYQDLTQRLAPPVWAGGSWAHPFGTDALGRDLLARLADGIRVSLVIVVATVLISTFIGTALGLVAGFWGGLFDSIVMRLVDVQLAFPQILLVLLVVGTIGPGVGTLIATLSITTWVLYARVVRSQTLAIKNQEYIEAARSIGSTRIRTAVMHVLPNVSGQLIVLASFAAANVVLFEAALSFLGLGVPSPQPSLGGIIADGQVHLTSDPWLSVLPGIAIFLLVIGANLLGDWLREVLDPRGTLRQGKV
ncbi:MAG: ABC transporter permease [Nocardioides sp.]|uniref:ABC transporter permease n=1 Tax=Nocardioides sp. TaxID=35761 RepID=UPI0039E64298